MSTFKKYDRKIQLFSMGKKIQVKVDSNLRCYYFIILFCNRNSDSQCSCTTQLYPTGGFAFSLLCDWKIHTTCYPDLNDKPPLANQQAQTKHVALSTAFSNRQLRVISFRNTLADRRGQVDSTRLRDTNVPYTWAPPDFCLTLPSVGGAFCPLATDSTAQTLARLLGIFEPRNTIYSV